MFLVFCTFAGWLVVVVVYPVLATLAGWLGCPLTKFEIRSIREGCWLFGSCWVVVAVPVVFMPFGLMFAPLFTNAFGFPVC